MQEQFKMFSIPVFNAHWNDSGLSLSGFCLDVFFLKFRHSLYSDKKFIKFRYSVSNCLLKFMQLYLGIFLQKMKTQDAKTTNKSRTPPEQICMIVIAFLKIFYDWQDIYSFAKICMIRFFCGKQNLMMQKQQIKAERQRNKLAS